jgi:MoaA/NifB/PqqE/SkfB family radical SAM enzyme
MNDIINGIHGWYFGPEVIAEANRKGQMLTMDYELGRSCPLRCIYCYRTDDSRDEQKDLLDTTIWKHVVDDARELGVQSVKLIGGGEITQEPDFREAMEYIAGKGMIVVLFTAGTVLGNDNYCRKLHKMSSRELAQWMYDLGMSVFIKVDSLNHELQDKIAGFDGFAVIRDRALELLIDVGFNKPNPTRLGLEVNVSRHNIHEIMDIYALRTKFNVYEDVVVSMPCDALQRNKDYDITYDQKRDLYRSIYAFNQEHGIPYEFISPFIGGLVCSQLGNGLYVTNRGDVFHCPGSFVHLGNVKDVSLKGIWKQFSEKEKYHGTYFCPFREDAGIFPAHLVEELRAELESHRVTAGTKVGDRTNTA